MKVLVASRDTGSGNSIAPVVQRLRKESRVEVVLIGYGPSIDVFKKAGIKYRTINSYEIQDISPVSMSRVLLSEKPNVLLLGTSPRTEDDQWIIEQSLISAARFSSTVLTCIVSIADQWFLFKERFCDSAGNLCYLPDIITVIDEFARKNAIRESIPEDRLEITGSPHFDGLVEEAGSFTAKRKQEIRDRIGLECELLFFFAAGVFESEKKRFGFWDLDVIKIMAQVLSDLPKDRRQQVGIVMKPHPKQKSEREHQKDLYKIISYLSRPLMLGSGPGERIRIVSDIDTHGLVLASDCTLTSVSMVGTEAVLMDKPVISLQPGLKDNQDDLLVVSKLGIVPVGHRKPMCRYLLKKAMREIKYLEEITKKSSRFRTDGKATERVVQLVYRKLDI